MLTKINSLANKKHLEIDFNIQSGTVRKGGVSQRHKNTKDVVNIFRKLYSDCIYNNYCIAILLPNVNCKQDCQDFFFLPKWDFLFLRFNNPSKI